MKIFVIMPELIYNGIEKGRLFMNPIHPVEGPSKSFFQEVKKAEDSFAKPVAGDLPSAAKNPVSKDDVMKNAEALQRQNISPLASQLAEEIITGKLSSDDPSCLQRLIMGNRAFPKVIFAMLKGRL